jgi:hypothetical protein
MTLLQEILQCLKFKRPFPHLGEHPQIFHILQSFQHLSVLVDIQDNRRRLSISKDNLGHFLLHLASHTLTPPLNLAETAALILSPYHNCKKNGPPLVC